MEEEIWKDILGYEGYYKISSLGRVKSVPRVITLTNGHKKSIQERICKPHLNINGYEIVVLSKNGILKNKSVSRLVGFAFIPNPENKPCIDHINGNRRDNRVENLRWCTRKENDNFELAKKHRSEARRGEKAAWYGKFGADNPRSKPISKYSKEGEIISTYSGLSEAGRETGIHIGNISSACNGRYKTAGGYIWKYVSGTEFEGQHKKK